MTDIIKVLTRKNSLRKQCQELSVADLEKISLDLAEIIEERKAAEAERAEAEREKNEKIAEIRQTMEAAGIDFSDLQDLVSLSTKKKVEAKYRITVDGETHEWSGRGRTPVVFQKYFDENNKTKEDCLIK